MFAHGTRGAEERVILKPDWASSTAKQLVQLLTTGQMSAQEVKSCDRESWHLLQEAAQQILLNISLRVPDFVDDRHRVGILNHAQTDLLFNVIEQLNGPKVELNFPSSLSDGVGTGCKPISVDNWLTLLEQGFAIKKSDEPASFFQVVAETSPPPQEAGEPHPELDGLLSSLDLDLALSSPMTHEERQYQLQAYSSTSSIGTMLNTMCQMLHRHRSVPDVRAYSKEEFSLRLPCGLALIKSLKSLSKRGLKVKVHRGNTLGYYLGGSNNLGCCPTVYGNLQKIQAFLNVIPEEMMRPVVTGNSSFISCSLKVCAPSSETLDRLVKATGACKDNPNTLGVDVRSNAFFAVKSVSDMRLLLAAMIDGGGSVDNGDVVPTLFILGYPKGVF